MRFDESSCSSLHTFVLRVSGCSNTSFRAWQSIHKVIAVICVLDETQVIILGVVAVAVGAVADSDVVVAVGSSGCEKRGWGLAWGAVGRLGSECRRF